MAYRLARFIIRLILQLVARLELEGWKILPGSKVEPGDFNHLGRLDVALCIIIWTGRTLLLVAEVPEVVWVRWFVKVLGAVFVDRFNADLNTMRIAMKHLQQGKVWCWR
jgi:1-acyl-sn-glycerol-3-phosphate acyltransferase